MLFFFFSSRRRHTRYWRDWSSDVCSSDLHSGHPRQRGRRDGQLLRVGAGPGWLLLGRRDGEPAARVDHDALVQRGHGAGRQAQGEHPHRLLHARGGPRGGDAPAAWDVCVMRYRVVAVGRVKHAALRTACDDYLERLRHYTRIEERDVKDEARLLEAIPEGSRLVALSRTGDQWTSEQLADWTARWELDARDVTFAIGGADGLSRATLRGAERVWSFSLLTLPHELARVLLYEQLYRAYTIRRGEPYHRGP